MTTVELKLMIIVCRCSLLNGRATESMGISVKNIVVRARLEEGGR